MNATPHSLPTRGFRLRKLSLLPLLLGAAAVPAFAQEPEEDVLLESRTPELPAWAEDNFARIDAGVDGWSSEVMHSAAKKVLKPVVVWVADAHAPAPPAQGFADGFRVVTPLRPPDLTTVVDRPDMRVRRASSLDARADDRPLEALAAELREALPGEHPHPFFKFVEIRPEAGGMRAKALLHWSNHSDAGEHLVNAMWMTDWEVGASDEDLRLRGIALLSYEEVWTPRRLFGEITEQVFGGLPFWDAEVLSGVDDYHQKVDRLIGQSFIGSQGLAVADVDGDGRDDVYLCNQGGVPNRLLLARPGGHVVDHTEASGLGFLECTRSALFLDLDGDGDQDFVCSIGPNLLVARNDGNAVFSAFTPLNGPGIEDVYSIAAGDADGDGDLDLYACRYVANGIMGGVPTPYHDADNGATNIYWRNEGDGRFTDATEEAGFASNNRKFSLAALWEDVDDDGDLDLYVANDFGCNNLFLNAGGVFRDVALERGAEDRAAGMGLSGADIDLDGDLDLLITNMFSSAGLRIAPQERFQGDAHTETVQHYLRHARGNTLLANDGTGHYTDVTETAGIAVAGWSWGSVFVDFDNDGYPDIYSPNGFLTGPDPDDL